MKTIVFICSPFARDVAGNIDRARSYGRFAITEKVIPIIPHLMYPQFLDEDDRAERQLGIEMGLALLAHCREVWVFGSRVSSGMAVEIERAQVLGIPVKYFTVDCKRVVD